PGVILYATLLVCAFGAATLVYHHDLYEPESLPTLGLSVAFGIGAMWFAGRTEAWTFALTHISSAGAVAVIAAFEEELLKLLVVVGLICCSRCVNDPMDGLVYGSMAGLGMAVEESIY